MPRRITVVENNDDDDVIIDLRRRREPGSRRRGGETAESSPPAEVKEDLRTVQTNALALNSKICNLIELRAESSFRVNQPDFEIVYALSGSDPNSPDTFHHFASQQVVEDARPDTVTPVVSGIIELITQEREGTSPPKLIVVNHTHPAPGNIPRPSTNDERFFEAAGKVLSEKFPEARVLFGVHAISGESIRRRERPTVKEREPNCLRWASVIREHELAFFTPNGANFTVDFHE